MNNLSTALSTMDCLLFVWQFDFAVMTHNFAIKRFQTRFLMLANHAINVRKTPNRLLSVYDNLQLRTILCAKFGTRQLDNPP